MWVVLHPPTRGIFWLSGSSSNTGGLYPPSLGIFWLSSLMVTLTGVQQCRILATICIALMTSDVERLFYMLFGYFISFVENYLFKSFAHVWNGLFCCRVIAVVQISGMYFEALLFRSLLHLYGFAYFHTQSILSPPGGGFISVLGTLLPLSSAISFVVVFFFKEYDGSFRFMPQSLPHLPEETFWLSSQQPHVMSTPLFFLSLSAYCVPHPRTSLCPSQNKPLSPLWQEV